MRGFSPEFTFYETDWISENSRNHTPSQNWTWVPTWGMAFSGKPCQTSCRASSSSHKPLHPLPACSLSPSPYPTFVMAGLLHWIVSSFSSPNSLLVSDSVMAQSKHSVIFTEWIIHPHSSCCHLLRSYVPDTVLQSFHFLYSLKWSYNKLQFPPNSY